MKAFRQPSIGHQRKLNALGSARRRTGWLLIAAAVVLGGTGARAEHMGCWDSQTSRITSYSEAQTLGKFELTGIARAREDENNALKFQCSGTFLADQDGKTYNYFCELTDPAGDKFILQNGDAKTFGALEYVAGGTGKYAKLSGAATEFAEFPLNDDGTLPACARAEGDFRPLGGEPHTNAKNE
jgi:hypothetical protein